VERVAILPVENLTSEASLDWMGPLAQASLESQSSGLTALFSFRARSMPESLQGRPTHWLKGYFTGGSGELRLTVYHIEAPSEKTLRVISEPGPAAQGPLPILNRIARRLWPQARDVGTSDRRAAQFYGEALASDSAGQAIPHLVEAIKQDPGFSDARLLLVRMRAATGDRQAALQALREGLENIRDPLNRARLAVLRAGLEGTESDRARAMEQLSTLLPADAEVAAQLGGFQFSRRQYPAARQYFLRALQADPDWGDIWNQKAYLEARLGNVEAALADLKRYAALTPGSANPLDSAGEIYFLSGRFQESEQAFLDAYQKHPAFLAGATLRKAAEARRMQGDLTGADTLFNKYADLAGNNPALDLLKAQWDYSSGRKRQAMDRLKKISAADLMAQALSQLAVWSLDGGDRLAAREAAAQAKRQATGGAGNRLAAIAVFVTSEDVPASHWSERAEQDFPSPADAAVKRHALGYALVYNRHFREAALVWKQLYESTHPNAEDHVRELLALSYAESGQWDKAQPLLQRFPIPQSTGEPTFDCLVFPRGIDLRARLAERAGDRQRAGQLRDLFRKLGGSS
jgi:Tfp pilus assembly protein PilF